MIFASPEYLLLLVVPVLWAILLRRRGTSRPTQSLTGHAGTGDTAVAHTWRIKWLRLVPWVQAGVMTLMVISLARPAAGRRAVRSSAEAIDITLVLDTSGSMTQTDLDPPRTRMDVTKGFARALVKAREGDRVSVVTFARNARVVAPLTFDTNAAAQLIEDLSPVELEEEDGTAIGIGLGVATRRLRQSKAISKVVVLLTDGENNLGAITPAQAADMAAGYGVRVHTILAGKVQQVGLLGRDPGATDLRGIATRTGGEYFRARDASTLMAIGQKIDTLERTAIENAPYAVADDRYAWFLVPAMLLLLLLGVMEALFVRPVP